MQKHSLLYIGKNLLVSCIAFPSGVTAFYVDVYIVRRRAFIQGGVKNEPRQLYSEHSADVTSPFVIDRS